MNSKIVCAFTLLLSSSSVLFAEDESLASAPNCCRNHDGISYCDSSSGRYVCGNGEISQCYCTRHAIMDLQLLKGCCTWDGGIDHITSKGKVICRNGKFAEMCTLERQVKQPVAF